MTGQTLLNMMELVNAELQLQSGEEDVVKGLLALNVAQDFFESLIAQRAKAAGSGTGTVTASAGVETTAFPAGLLRIDRLQLMGDAGLPIRDLDKLQRAGGHSANSRWYMNLISTVGTGAPRAYWTNGTSIYWQPVPSSNYTIRWYGLSAASDVTAAGTFAYPDIVAFPIATFAAKLIKTGLDDPAQDLGSLASETFGPVLDTLFLFNRDGASGLEYTQFHQE